MSYVPVDDDLTFVDEFCGAGGATQGLTEAGLTPILAVNHWDRAVETHAANFPDVEHWCEDTSRLDMRRLPRARILWASPICTEASPAGGRKRRRRKDPAQLELDELGHVPQPGMIRTRTTFYDVLRAVEVRRFDVVLIENVVEVARDWELFDHWIEGMKLLGYNVQFVSVSSAHVGSGINPRAPQWRDRLYLVFSRIGIPLPDVEPRPLAWCPVCVQDVYALQHWKNPRARHIGKYGDRAQYVYVCERSECRHTRVEPYVVPAAAAIDWTDLGTRIGDRKPRKKDGLPLAPATLHRIASGLWMFGQPITVEKSGNTYERPGSGYVRAWPALDSPLTSVTGSGTKGLAGTPVMLSTNHDDGARAYPVDAAPLPCRTVKIGDGMAIAPFVDVARTHNRPSGVDEPLAPLTTGRNHGLVTSPLLVEHRRNGEARPVDDQPTSTITTGSERGGSHHSVVVPPGAFVAKAYTPRGAAEQMVKDPTDQPLGAITGSDHHQLVVPDGAFYVKNYGGNARPQDMVRDVAHPLGTITGKDHHALVIPFRRGARPHRVGAAPLSTLTTHESHALLLAELGVDLYDCLFRMLQPGEHLAAQRFPTGYIVHGNVGEQTMQAGNAVSANVPHWLGRAVAIALGAVAA